MAIARSSQARTPIKASGPIVFDDRETIALAACLPQPLDGRMQETLPRVRPDGIAEERRIGARLEPVSPAVLPIGPPDREIIKDRNPVVDDRAIPHGRADHPVATALEGIDDSLQSVTLDRQFGPEPIR